MKYATVSLDRLTTYLLFSFYFHADECYDASNIITCEDELETGNGGDIEVVHACSKTCEALSYTGNTHEIVHQVTNFVI